MRMPIRGALCAALLCSAMISTPALAFHDPGGASATTESYVTAIGDTTQATAPPDTNVGRDSRTFNIDMLDDTNDSTAIGGAADHSAAPLTDQVNGSSDTR